MESIIILLRYSGNCVSVEAKISEFIENVFERFAFLIQKNIMI
jgi:hypothetical protein